MDRRLSVFILGVYRSFDIDQIGGTDSFYRRLSFELLKRGHTVEYVIYGDNNETVETYRGLKIHRFSMFSDALKYMHSRPSYILVNAIKACDRLRFMHFRYKSRSSHKFYIIFSYYAPTLYGRFKHFLEAFLLPYNGGAVCMSQRLASCAAHFRNKSAFILPPVPDEYYCPIDVKMERPNERLVVTYVGRLEEAKGIRETIQILERLSHEDRFECRLYGYSFDGDLLANDYHKRIMKNDRIFYRKLVHKNWSSDLETQLGTVLRETDILLLPYQTVSSSIDTPLLLLEGMANLCCCITRPLGDIPSIYGSSPFLIDDTNVDDFASKVCALIEQADENTIETERRRLQAQRGGLGFDLPSVTHRLLGILGEK